MKSYQEIQNLLRWIKKNKYIPAPDDGNDDDKWLKQGSDEAPKTTGELSIEYFLSGYQEPTIMQILSQ